MASYQNENRPDPGDLISWIVTIVLLVSPVWPIGLILLFRKLTRDSRRRRTSRHRQFSTTEKRRQQPQQPHNPQ